MSLRRCPSLEERERQSLYNTLKAILPFSIVTKRIRAVQQLKMETFLIWIIYDIVFETAPFGRALTEKEYHKVMLCIIGSGDTKR